MENEFIFYFFSNQSQPNSSSWLSILLYLNGTFCSHPKLDFGIIYRLPYTTLLTKCDIHSATQIIETRTFSYYAGNETSEFIERATFVSREMNKFSQTRTTFDKQLFHILRRKFCSWCNCRECIICELLSQLCCILYCFIRICCVRCW